MIEPLYDRSGSGPKPEVFFSLLLPPFSASRDEALLDSDDDGLRRRSWPSIVYVLCVPIVYMLQFFSYSAYLRSNTEQLL